MDAIKAIILGIVEGLTEFLPVSSTGHLILVEHALGIDGDKSPWKALLWVSQFAAILAVILYFWRDLWHRTADPLRAAWRRIPNSPGNSLPLKRRLRIVLSDHILTKLVVAMVPTIILALLFHKYATRLEKEPAAVAGALIAGAVVMEYIDRHFRRHAPQTLDNVTLPQAFLIGLIQCLSMWPGVSRSATTIMGGMVLGLTPSVATEFSFYLAIPTMLAAAVYALGENWHALGGANLGLLLLGSATAFVVALLVVATFLRYVRRYRFTPFVVYRVLLGLVVLGYWLTQRP